MWAPLENMNAEQSTFQGAYATGTSRSLGVRICWRYMAYLQSCTVTSVIEAGGPFLFDHPVRLIDPISAFYPFCLGQPDKMSRDSNRQLSS